MREPGGKIRWRVRAKDNQRHVKAFDALILSSDRPTREQIGSSRLIALDVPFERELPDAELTLIIRANHANVPLVNECDLLDANGTRRTYGRSIGDLSVFVFSNSGMMVTGLPSPGSNPELERDA